MRRGHLTDRLCYDGLTSIPQRKGHTMRILGMGIPELTILQVFIIPIAMFVVGLITTNLLIKIAKEKGHYRDSAALLWVIGIFCTPIVLGIYVIALPDRGVPVPTAQPAAVPVAPTMPVAAATSAAPVSTAAPVAPTASAAPVAPVATTAPVAPAAPAAVAAPAASPATPGPDAAQQ